MPDREEIQGAPLASAGLGLGERLRSARKARALSVQQVADGLRLEEASVIALEDGRFAAMGAPVFVRGHLRRYAELVGLSPEAVLEAYRASAPDSDAPPSIARPRQQADTVRVPPWVYWAGAALILAGLVFALVDSGDEAPAVTPAPVQQESQQSIALPETAAPEDEPSATAVPAAAPPPEAPPAVSAPVAAPSGNQPGAGE